MTMNFNPVSAQAVVLPESWSRLEEAGFHQDLVERARRFKLLAERDGYPEKGKGILEWVGSGFAKRFDRSRFEPKADDADYVFKIQFLDAIQELADEFGDRVSSVVWEALAFMGTRPNPHEEAMIPNCQQYLTMHFGLADAVLHALPDVFGLFLHCQSRIFAHAGVVLEHNCDCSHSAKEAKADAVVRCFLDPSRFIEATNALLTHLLSNAKLIMVDGYPFNFGLSPEFEAAMAIAAR